MPVDSRKWVRPAGRRSTRTSHRCSHLLSHRGIRISHDSPVAVITPSRSRPSATSGIVSVTVLAPRTVEVIRTAIAVIG